MSRRCFKRRMATSIDDVKSALFWRAVVAEFVGTGFLVLFGCGSCTGWGDDHQPSMTQIGLGFGLIVGAMVWSIAHVSGGHINPAVTVAMLITRNISVARATLFIIAQCLGATAGAAVLYGVTPAAYRGAMGATLPNAHITATQAFGVEFCITFVLVFTVFASCDSQRTDLNGSAPLTIGLSVAVGCLFGGTYTGGSMNPARSLGPAIMTGLWHEHWVYWCGPILGAIVASLLYESVFAANASLSKARGYLLASDYTSAKYQENKEKPYDLIENQDTSL